MGVYSGLEFMADEIALDIKANDASLTVEDLDVVSLGDILAEACSAKETFGDVTGLILEKTGEWISKLPWSESLVGRFADLFENVSFSKSFSDVFLIAEVFEADPVPNSVVDTLFCWSGTLHFGLANLLALLIAALGASTAFSAFDASSTVFRALTCASTTVETIGDVASALEA